MAYQDIKNQKFGRWTVIEGPIGHSASGTLTWKCRCECGTERIVDGSSLRRGKSTSCGCYNKEVLSNRSNLIGQQFDKLKVISKSENSVYGQVYWVCECECGNICERTTTYLHRKDFVHSCGCMMTEHFKKDITGQRFGKLVALLPIKKEKEQKYIYWKCKCDCGNEVEVRTNSLISHNTNSCGCINYSIGEQHIEDILKTNNLRFKSQYTNSDLGKKKYDFAILDDNYNPIRLIEFDGRQHYNDISGIWNSPESLVDIQKRDKIKNQWALANNVPLVRIPYWERDNITLDMIMGDQYLVCE